MKSLLGTAWKPPKSLTQVVRRWRSSRPSAPSESRYPQESGYSQGARTISRSLLRDGLQHEGHAAKKRPDYQTKRNYQMFQSVVEARFQHVVEHLGAWASKTDEFRSFGINSQSQLDREVGLFKMVLDKAFTLATEHGQTGRQENPLFWNLRNAFIRFDAPGLGRELKYAFQTFMMRSRFPKVINELHMALADLRFPYEWYPATRMIQRTIHLHVGPTNSGKTYNALKALENARTGIYAGPLRLLAHEIWSRFTAKRRPCALITGEEQRIPEDSDTWFHSCTVEMAPLNTRVDVAVIDEIQMIANDERGWAWTQAFLGIQAKELHLCGEERVVELVQDLCARLGEECIVHRYQRLNPLMTMDESLKGKFSNLRKGDAVVSFSRVGIHSLKAGIEAATGRRCAIVYGSLPPETRASQAALFNDPNNEYDYLVASDAIGMGLNLEIKRVIFESSTKYDGVTHRKLGVPEIKQIGGRAGRYRTATQEMTGAAVESGPAPGLVTSLDDEDLHFIKKAFDTDVGPLQTAGLFPPASVIERFHSYFPPRTPTSFVLARLREMARLSGRFHLCDFRTAFAIAEIIQPYDLSISDRCIFLNVPINLKDELQVSALRAFAQCVAEMGSGHLLDFDEVDLEVLDEDSRANPKIYLHRLESLHQTVTMYLWLSYRYQGVFQSQHLAFKVKQLTEDKINEHLERLNFVPELHRKIRQKIRKMAARTEKKMSNLVGPDEESPVPRDEGVGRWNEEGHEEPLFEDDVDEAVDGDGVTADDLGAPEVQSGTGSARRQVSSG
ncbi:hypothetical protein VTK56DRAFT_3979 [Thermocarpiscus australiensis]